MTLRRLTIKGAVWCVAISIAMSCFAFVGTGAFEAWEYVFLDWHLQQTTAGHNGQKIALILGGDKSMIELDSWPWPRETHATLINERLHGASVIALDIFLVDRTT